jgi:2,6-dihydroxypseudooxynicotine hydrolase
LPDPRVQAAIAHWGPRFVQAGVDMNDFLATTQRIDAWDEWLDEWCATGDVHAALAREAAQAGHALSAGEGWARAAVAYHFAQFVWVLDAERAKAASRKAIQALYNAHSLLDTSAERVEAPLDGAHVVANVRRPTDAERPPLVILIPGLDSTKEEFLQFENVFLARGIATASLDGPGQGETGRLLALRHDYEVAVSALLDELDGRTDIDLDRVGAMGVSLGGYYAPRAATFEPRIKAVAGISGPFNFMECWEAAPPLSRETFMVKARAENEDQARSTAEKIDLTGVLDKLNQPYLAVTGKLDRLVPWEQTERQAREAPNGQFVLHEDGNHGCANVPYKTRPLVADWLREQLG